MGKSRFSWISFLARRYLYGKERTNRNITQILSAIGLAAGVMTLISVISVMNGLQMGYISDILEIGSYHIRIDSDKDDLSLEKNIEKIKGVESVVSFADIQVLAKGELSRMNPINIRCINEEKAVCDKGFMEHLEIINGNFDFVYTGDRPYVVIGCELARYLHLNVGDIFSVMALAGENFNSLKPETFEFVVSGIYKSGYYEYDRQMAIMSISDATMLFPGNCDIKLGVKLKNKYGDRAIVENISMITDKSIVSWREFNKALFGALRMEKFAMMFLISLIFLVIGVNIFNFMKRSVSEKAQDMAVLYSLGVNPLDVRWIFIFEGLFVGLLGGLIGVMSGLLISVNLNEIFVYAGKILSLPVKLFSMMCGYFFDFGEFEFRLFSPDYFYIQEIPVSILFPEVVCAFVFALCSAVLSAVLSVKKLDIKNPANVLKVE